MLEVFEIMTNTHTFIASLLAPVSAGEPVNVSSELSKVDLNQLLGEGHCLLLRIHGDSMTVCGIDPGDMVILSRTREPKTDDIVIASVDDEYVIKKLVNTPQRGLRLVAGNSAYKDRCICDEDDCEILGVVTTVIKKFV